MSRTTHDLSTAPVGARRPRRSVAVLGASALALSGFAVTGLLTGTALAAPAATALPGGCAATGPAGTRSRPRRG